MTKSPISPAGRAKMLAEIDHLVRVERPRVSAEVQWAASLGDRSENSEYIYGKQRMRDIDRRWRYLTDRVEATVVIDPCTLERDTVGFGAIVDVEDEEGQAATWSLLGEDEVDIAGGVLSARSPLGKALVGKRADDVVTWETPKGARELTILAVRYPKPSTPA